MRNIEARWQLSAAAEAQRYRHYGLDYDTAWPDLDPGPSHPAAHGPTPTSRPHRPDRTDEPAIPPEGSVERHVDGGCKHPTP